MYQEEAVSRPAGLSQSETTVSTHLPALSPAQATVLALWSFGMVLARSCGITSVAALLAPWLDAKENTVRQRLREWCYDAQHKRGTKRQDLDVSTCFAPLLRWVLAWWPATAQRLLLAMDASTLGQRFTVLTSSVVYRGCAIPVAWVVLPACRKGAWRPHWEALFDPLAGSVPADWTVLVMADRGLYARALSAPRQAGLAPVSAHQSRGQRAAPARRHLSPLGDAGPQGGQHVERAGHLLVGPAEPVGLYVAGALGCGLHRGVVNCDRLGGAGSRGGMVWHADVDRGRLQGH
jgi:hypothetical protein